MADIACPNIKLPEWRKLKKELGEARAYISFFRHTNESNKFEIPGVDRAREVLGMLSSSVAANQEAALARIRRMNPEAGKPVGAMTLPQVRRAENPKSSFDGKIAKEQKKFLLDKTDEAIKEAPDIPQAEVTKQWEASEENRDQQIARKWAHDNPEPRQPESYDREIYRDDPVEKEKALAAAIEKWKPMVLAWHEKMEAALAPLVQKYFPEPSIGSALDKIESGTEKAFHAKRPHITIQVPGDGEFSVVNTKDALRDFRSRAEKFPTTQARAARPSSARTTPSKVPDIGDTSKENVVKAASLATSEDESRFVLHHIWSDGKQTVATNGRWLLRILKGLGGTEKKPQLFEADGKPSKEKLNYPNYTAVLPNERDLNKIFTGLDTGKVWTILKQAEQMTSERANSVKLWRNPDGSIGISSNDPEVGEYQHNVGDGAKVVGAWNPGYLMDALEAARRTGSEKVDGLWINELSPLVIRGKTMEAVIMPMRMSDGGVSGDGLSKYDLAATPAEREAMMRKDLANEEKFSKGDSSKADWLRKQLGITPKEEPVAQAAKPKSKKKAQPTPEPETEQHRAEQFQLLEVQRQAKGLDAQRQQLRRILDPIDEKWDAGQNLTERENALRENLPKQLEAIETKLLEHRKYAARLETLKLREGQTGKEILDEAVQRVNAALKNPEEEEPAANLGTGLGEGEGMSADEVSEAIKGQDTAGFEVQTISKDDAARITGRPEARGYGGFFYQGKIYLVADNIGRGRVDELHQLLREEVGHGLLRTAEGMRQLQAVLDAGKLNLTEAEKAALRSKGYQENQLLDEFIAKSAAENRPWWKQAVDTIRSWLAKAGLANLSNDEVARLLVKEIKNEIAGIGGFFISPPATQEVSPGEAIPPGDDESEPDDLDSGIKVRIGSKTIKVAGRDTLKPEQKTQGDNRAFNLLQRLNLPVEPDADNVATIKPDGFNYDAEGRQLIEELSHAIETQNQTDGDPAYSSALVRFINYNVNPEGGWYKILSPDVANKLTEISAGESSWRGWMLRAIKGVQKDLLTIGANMPLFLQKTYSRAFSGKDIQDFVSKVLTLMGRDFTDDELKAVADSKPQQKELVDQIMQANRKDEGGQVYRRVQSLLKPKSKPKISRLESNARVVEAVNKIIADAKNLGIEPPKDTGKKLSPVEKLLHMIKPETVEKLNTLIKQAVADAERNAGIAEALKEEAKHGDSAVEELRQRFVEGEEPSAAQVERGLNDPRYAHWRAIRDNLLGYSPVTGKLASKVVPTISQLAKEILKTPAYLQPEMRAQFIQKLAEEHNLSDDQAARVADAITQTYGEKLAAARVKAQDDARKALSPDQKLKLPPNDKKLWDTITQFFNAGGTDSAELLRKIAAAKGLPSPTDDQIKSMQLMVERVQKLSATPESKATHVAEISKLMKEMGVQWAKFNRPFNLEHWGNIASAGYEFATANLLAKFGFPIRLTTHIVTQLLVHTPTRILAIPIRQALRDKSAVNLVPDILHQAINYKDTGKLWEDVHNALRDTFVATLDTTQRALRAARAQLKGRGEILSHDRLMSSVTALERASAAAREYWQKKDYARASLLYLISSLRLATRVVGAIDSFQGEFVEAQEMRHQIFLELAAQGKSRAEIAQVTDKILSGMKSEWTIALADARRIFDQYEADPSNLPPGLESAASKWSKGQRENAMKEAADKLVKDRAYLKMQEAGLPADSMRAYIYRLRMANAWQEPTRYGIGGVATTTMNKIRSLGIPMLPVEFANAIGAGINYHLRMTPAYYFADVGSKKAQSEGKIGSAWTEKPEDVTQRQVQAIFGTLIGATLVGMVMNHLLKVNLAPPTDPKERDKFIRDGHKAGTVEIMLPDGSFIPFSLTVGPFAVVSPYLAGAGATRSLIDSRAAQQQKLNEEAAKKGIPAGKIKPIDSTDILGVAVQAAWQTILGGSTASGLTGGYTEFGVPNAKKATASFISPFVPYLPAYQEISRMMGVAMDKNMATVFDYLVPLPTSGARLVNALGDPVRTPDDAQRIIQAITAGTYPLPVHPGTADAGAAYQALFASGFNPPAIDGGRGYNINGTLRPMTPDELSKYTELRGQYLKEAITGMGASATRPEVAAAYKTANARALQAVGVQLSPQNEKVLAGGSAPPKSRGTRRLSLASRGKSFSAPKIRLGKLHRPSRPRLHLASLKSHKPKKLSLKSHAPRLHRPRLRLA